MNSGRLANSRPAASALRRGLPARQPLPSEKVGNRGRNSMPPIRRSSTAAIWTETRSDPRRLRCSAPGSFWRDQRVHRLLHRLYGGGIPELGAMLWQGPRTATLPLPVTAWTTGIRGWASSASKESAARLVQMAGSRAVPVAEPLLMGNRRAFGPRGSGGWLEQHSCAPPPLGSRPARGSPWCLPPTHEECRCGGRFHRELSGNRGHLPRSPTTLCWSAPSKVWHPLLCLHLPQGDGYPGGFGGAGAALDCAAEGFSAGNILRFAKRQRWQSPREEAAELKTTAMCGMWAVGTAEALLKTIRMAPRPTFPSTRPAGARQRGGCAAGDPSAELPAGLREADGPGSSTGGSPSPALEHPGAEHIEALCRAAEPRRSVCG